MQRNDLFVLKVVPLYIYIHVDSSHRPRACHNIHLISCSLSLSFTYTHHSHHTSTTHIMLALSVNTNISRWLQNNKRAVIYVYRVGHLFVVHFDIHAETLCSEPKKFGFLVGVRSRSLALVQKFVDDHRFVPSKCIFLIMIRFPNLVQKDLVLSFCDAPLQWQYLTLIEIHRNSFQNRVKP